MAKFSLYNIPLKNLSQGIHTYSYLLDSKFFDAIDGDEVRKGRLSVSVVVKRTSSAFNMEFDINGMAQVPCTRCLDDMEQEVNVKSHLVVKFGQEYSEESDEIVIIPEDDGEINIAWFLYEFIALSIPIKHVHPPGECNRVVASKFKKHRAVNVDDQDDDNDETTEDDTDDDEGVNGGDPRWDALRELNLDDN